MDHPGRELRLPRARALIALLLSLAPATAHAAGASGSFVASRPCEAFSSFQKKKNPGAVKLAPGERYEVKEVNKKTDYDWVRVEVPGSEPTLRWVALECGTFEGAARSGAPPRETGRCNTPGDFESYVLALSWQPGFCEHFSYSGKKPECDALMAGKPEAAHLTVHGLWPNKRMCGAEYGDCPGPDLELTDQTVRELRQWMPNLAYEDALARHEWKKHGNCQSLPDDEYFRAMKTLAERVDASPLGAFVKSHAGGEVKVGELFAALPEEVAARVTLVCAGGSWLQEVRLSLPRPLVLEGDLEALTRGAPPTGHRTEKCKGDVVKVERAGPG